MENLSLINHLLRKLRSLKINPFQGLSLEEQNDVIGRYLSSNRAQRVGSSASLLAARRCVRGLTIVAIQRYEGEIHLPGETRLSPVNK